MKHIIANYTCSECRFHTSDLKLMQHHSCDVQEHGGFCEDYPACGHEQGDCNGLLYGSDEAIKEHAMIHAMCDHENGQYECAEDEEEDAGDEDDDAGDEDDPNFNEAYANMMGLR